MKSIPRAFLAVAALLLLATAGAEIIDENTPVPPVGAEGGPSIELTPGQLEQWKRGRIVFDRDFHSTDGLGTPDLNGDSCRGCHIDPVIGGAGGLDVNVFRFGSDNDGMGPFMDLPGGQAGSKLRRPGTPGRENAHVDADVFEQRQTPTALGLGFIDSIDDADIIFNQDLADMNGDGIYGYARMIDIGGTFEVGKFGWKGQVPTVSDFIRDAMGGEIGITVADDGRGFGMLADGDGVPDPELAPADLDDILFYLSTLAHPPRGGSTDPDVALGEAYFTGIGCATCHIPELPGPDGPVPLYSNLLIHDIHSPGFRGMGEPGAPVGFYRTPPLWGISKTAPYLHDGLAATLEQAILAHEGEAELVRQAYEGTSKAGQEALLTFLRDL